MGIFDQNFHSKTKISISAPNDIKSVHRHNGENAKMGSVQQERQKTLPQPSTHNSLLPVVPNIVVGNGKRVCESPLEEARTGSGSLMSWKRGFNRLCYWQKV